MKRARVWNQCERQHLVGFGIGFGFEMLQHFRERLTTRSNPEKLSYSPNRIPTVSSETNVRKVPGTTESAMEGRQKKSGQ